MTDLPSTVDGVGRAEPRDAHHVDLDLREVVDERAHELLGEKSPDLLDVGRQLRARLEVPGLREGEAHVCEKRPVTVEAVDASRSGLVIEGVTRGEHEPMRIRVPCDELVDIGVEFHSDVGEFGCREASLVIERTGQRVGSHPHTLCKLLLLNPALSIAVRTRPPMVVIFRPYSSVGIIPITCGRSHVFGRQGASDVARTTRRRSDPGCRPSPRRSTRGGCRPPSNPSARWAAA